MKVNVYLRNLVNGKEISYGELWKVKKYSKDTLKKMTDEEKMEKAQMVVKNLNEIVKKRYWGHTPEFEYVVKGE